VGSSTMQDRFPVGKRTGWQSDHTGYVPVGKENWLVARTYRIYSLSERELVGSATVQDLFPVGKRTWG